MVSSPSFQDHDDANYRRYQRTFLNHLSIPDFQDNSRDNRAFMTNRTGRTGLPNEPQPEKAEAPTRKRIAVACGRCRKRKIRCSGDVGQNQPCSSCKSAGVTTCLFLRVSSRETPIKANINGSGQGNEFEYNITMSRALATRSAMPPMPYSPVDFGVNDSHLRSNNFYPAGTRAYNSTMSTSWNASGYETDYAAYNMSTSAPPAYPMVDPGTSAGFAPYPLPGRAKLTETAAEASAMVSGSRLLEGPKIAGTSGAAIDNIACVHGSTTLAHRPAPSAHEPALLSRQASYGSTSNRAHAVTSSHTEPSTIASSYLKAENGTSDALPVSGTLSAHHMTGHVSHSIPSHGIPSHEVHVHGSTSAVANVYGDDNIGLPHPGRPSTSMGYPIRDTPPVHTHTNEAEQDHSQASIHSHSHSRTYSPNQDQKHRSEHRHSQVLAQAHEARGSAVYEGAHQGYGLSDPFSNSIVGQDRGIGSQGSAASLENYTYKSSSVAESVQNGRHHPHVSSSAQSNKHMPMYTEASALEAGHQHGTYRSVLPPARAVPESFDAAYKPGRRH